MRIDLDFLPTSKRSELSVAMEIVRSGFAEALSRRTQERFRNGRLLKLVLFGSYARGEWVEDPVGRYFSDFDLLAVVDHEDLTDPSEFWGETERRLLHALTEGRSLRTPVSLIVHSLEDVNAQLRLGRPFFTDILRDGVLLHDTPGHPFAEAEALAPAAALAETQAAHDEWLASGRRALKGAVFYQAEGDMKDAVFLLHQATERFYHGLLLVRSLYSPKTHSLNRLRALCEDQDARVAEVWPASGKFERRCYERLREAYVKARYSPRYQIAQEELAWLMGRVTLLDGLVETICQERLRELRGAAAVPGSQPDAAS